MRAQFFAVLLVTATSIAPPGPARAADKPQTCPISVRVYHLENRPDETLFGIWSDAAAGTATGSIVAYTADRRYRIAFVNAVAADDRDPKNPPTPIVVAFPSSVQSAYIESLGGSTCAIHEPYVASGISPATVPAKHGRVKTQPVYPDWSQAMKTFYERASTVPVIAAPGGEPVDPPACEKPYVKPSLVHGYRVPFPGGQRELFDGSIAVKVDIAASGTLRGERIERSSHESGYDRAALVSAARSQFAPEIYRCEPVTGDYMFYVDFDWDAD